MKKEIVILGGDGIGPEVVHQAEKIIDAINNVFSHQFECSNELIIL